MNSPWTMAGPDLESAFNLFERPLDALAGGEVAAIVLRGVFPPADCGRLVDRLIEGGHLYDPRKPIPDRLLQDAVPEGFFSRTSEEDSEGVEYYRQRTDETHVRIDIGSSLGYRGEDREAFFEHSRRTYVIRSG